MTTEIVRFLEAKELTEIKKSDLRKIIESHTGISESEANETIDNLILTGRLFRGNPIKGSAFVSIEQVERQKNGGSTREVKDEFEWSPENVTLAEKIIDFIDKERHLELGRTIKEIVALVEINDDEFDEKLAKTVCRRLKDLGLLKEKLNARLGTKKRGRRSSDNVKTTRYMLAGADTRRVWREDRSLIINKLVY